MRTLVLRMEVSCNTGRCPNSAFPCRYVKPDVFTLRPTPQRGLIYISSVELEAPMQFLWDEAPLVSTMVAHGGLE